MYIYIESERCSWDAEHFEGCTQLDTNTDRELRKAHGGENPRKFVFSVKLPTAKLIFLPK
jgi:hypothetical protein